MGSAYSEQGQERIVKEEELYDTADGFDNYVDVLCKAILLDKVQIVDGKIKVKPF